MKGHGRNIGVIGDPHLTFLAAVVGILNVFILLIMLGVYISGYRKVKSSFTRGPCGLHRSSHTSEPYIHRFYGNQGRLQGSWTWNALLSVNLCQLSAILILLKITWQ